MGHLVLSIVLLSVALVAGCKKQETAAAADPTATAAPASPRGPGPMPDTATDSVVIADGNIDASLQQLSRELRKYVVRTRSVPKNFDEFVAKSHVQPPPAPAGKKYAIKDQAVVLVNH